jgi:hypothetical protein
VSCAALLTTACNVDTALRGNVDLFAVIFVVPNITLEITDPEEESPAGGGDKRNEGGNDRDDG